MDNLILNSIISLSGIGIAAAGILFFIATKFKVYENPKIDEVEEALPAANCGGCGYPGCRPFAEATVEANDLNGLYCPVGGNDTMTAVASILGLKVKEQEPMVARLLCNGSLQNAPAKVKYDGVRNCQSAHALFSGPSGCQFGCLGLADCVDVCQFDALKIDEKTGLPVVDAEKCTACNACVQKCPRGLFDLRPKDSDVYVACKNTEKGGAAKKNCSVACIGCMKCTKIYETDSIKVKNFLSYISPDVNKEFGSELVTCCPTKAIKGINLSEKSPVDGDS